MSADKKKTISLLVTFILFGTFCGKIREPGCHIDLNKVVADPLSPENRALLQDYNAAGPQNRFEMVKQHPYHFDRIFFILLQQGLIKKYRQPDAQVFTTARDIAEKFQASGDTFYNRQYRYYMTLHGKPLKLKYLAKAFYDKGYEFYIANEIKKAHRCYQRVLDICQKIKDNRLLADVSVQLSKLYCDTGELYRAVETAEHAFRIADSIGYRYRVQWARSAQMIALVDLGDYAAVIAIGEAGLEEMAVFGDQYCTVCCLDRIGVSYFRCGENNMALEKFNQALDIIHKHNSPFMERLKINCLIGMGAVYTMLGHYSNADGYFQKAEQCFEQIDASGYQTDQTNLAMLYLNNGDMYRRIKKYDKALAINHRALEILKKDIDPLRLAMAYRSIGNIYRDKGEKKNALVHYNHVMEIMKKWSKNSVDMRPKRLEAEINLAMGDIYAEGPTPHRARQHYMRALELGRNYTLKAVWVQTLYSLGILENTTGHVRRSNRYFEKALDLVQSLQYPVLTANIYLKMYQNIVGTAPDKAIILLNKAIETCEQNRVHSNAHFKILYFAGVQQIYEEMIGICYARGQYRKAYDYIQRSRARTLLEMSQREMYLRPPALTDLKNLLPPGTTILEYKVTKDNLYIFVLDRQRFEHTAIPLQRKILKQRVTEYRRSIGALDINSFRKKCRSDRNAVIKTYTRLGKSLYQDLVQPVAGEIDTDILYIIADDILNYLPFASLVTPEGQYLLQKLTIARAPCTSHLCYALQKKQAKQPAHKLSLFAVGNPTGDLHYAEHEIENVCQKFPECRVLLQSDVSEDRVRKGLNGPYDVFHFATHAIEDTANPEYSSLLLGGRRTTKKLTAGLHTRSSTVSVNDNILMAEEIAELDLSGIKLVTLSACHSAGGGLYAGEGFVGLTSAFLCAGTPAVVASLWAVDDRKTFQLISGFYNNWSGEGMSKAAALRKAQLEMINNLSKNTNPYDPHPFFWAAFEMWGDYR